MKDIKEMNQFEVARLENKIARALYTQRRLIRIDASTPLSDGHTDLRVILRGGFVYRLVWDGANILQVAREVGRA